MRRTWIALGVAVPLALALGVASCSRRAVRADEPADPPSIAKRLGLAPPPPPSLAGLDLAKIAIGPSGATAALPEKRTALLTIDPELQRAADAVLAQHHVPEAAVVLMDVATGRVLVYESRVEKGAPRDLCVEATAPAASVFKVVTASALVDDAKLGPEQRECYSGGEQRITERDLEPDPKRDRWCATLAGALGRSLNTVFARLAVRHLHPPELADRARTLGFGAPLAFDVPVQPSALVMPDDQLGFARTAAGFWNTTLSPIHAAWLSATIARAGEPIRPFVVSAVTDGGDAKPIWSATPTPEKRALRADTAQALTTMMETTVSDGTSFKAFHDGRGTPFLPGVTVAGKTGTLTDASSQRYYTWFTGFAPSKPYEPPEGKDGGPPIAPPRQVAVAVLVVNEPTWQVKANVVAREVLRAYFAEQKVPGVTAPGVHAGSAQESTTAGTKHLRHRGS